jgi:hypothetical protein
MMMMKYVLAVFLALLIVLPSVSAPAPLPKRDRQIPTRYEVLKKKLESLGYRVVSVEYDDPFWAVTLSDGSCQEWVYHRSTESAIDALQQLYDWFNANN